MNLSQLRSFEKMQLPIKKPSLTSRHSKVSQISLTPKPSKSRILKYNNDVDLTSTALSVSITPRKTSVSQELQQTQKELKKTKDLLKETINSYEIKLQNAEYIIELLREEIRTQIAQFKKEVYLNSDGKQVEKLRRKITIIQSEYEEKLKSMRNEKLCEKCKAFVSVSGSIQAKKELYDYLY